MTLFHLFLCLTIGNFLWGFISDHWIHTNTDTMLQAIDRTYFQAVALFGAYLCQ